MSTLFTNPDRQARFERSLDQALERGARREPRVQPVLVHAEVFQDFSPLYRRMRVFMDRLRAVDWQAGPPPLFWANPIHAAALEGDSFKPLFYHPDRVLMTEMNASLGTGYLAFPSAERFLKLHQDGIHPNDRWVFHGGEWHVCLTTAALQWGMSLTSKTWWARPDSPEEVAVQDEAARVILPVAETALPIEFGEVFDPQGVSKAEQTPFHWARGKNGAGFEPLAWARAFTRPNTRFSYL